MLQFSTLSRQDRAITVSSKGAELTSIKKGNREYLYQKQDGFWQRQSPVLFPIVGALLDNQFSHEKTIYHMTQHGFARDREFELVEQSEDALSFRLVSDAESRRIYPFDFSLMIRYTLTRVGVEINYSVENQGDEVLYFSIGGHPAFTLEENIEQYSIYFPQDTLLERFFLEGGLISHREKLSLDANRLLLTEELFERDALVFKSVHSKNVTLFHGDDRVLTIDRGNLSHLGIWRQNNAPFLCIEPWQGYASPQKKNGEVFMQKEGIVSLSSGRSEVFSWSIVL